MIHRILHSALCLFLSPLLAAQQAAQPLVQPEKPASGATPAETFFAYRSSINLSAQLGFGPARSAQSDPIVGLSVIPFQVPVELVPVDPAAWANATVGSTLILRVVDDAVMGRGPGSYVYAGNLIQAKVIRMRKGKPRTRHGVVEPRVKEVVVGKNIKLELGSSRRSGAGFSGIGKNIVVWSVKVPYTVVVFPVAIVGVAVWVCRGDTY